MIRQRALLAIATALILSACARRETPPSQESAPAASLPPAEAAVVAEQKPYYTLAECTVCRGPLDRGGGAVDVVQDGKLVRVCTAECREKLAGNPAPFLATRDSLLIAAQLAAYPTDSCVVMEDALDLMDTPRNFIWGARLIRVCCEACEEQFREAPAGFMAMLDEKAKAPAKPASLPRDTATSN
jgi:hypothetical protein